MCKSEIWRCIRRYCSKLLTHHFPCFFYELKSVRLQVWLLSMVAFVDQVSTWELWLQDSLPLPSSGSDLNLDRWSFRPNLEPSCHIGGRWSAFLPPPCRRKPSLSSMKTGEAWENPLVWVPTHLACPSRKEESRRVALCPQYLPLPGNPPPLAFLPQDMEGRCDGTQDWSLHSQQGVTDCRAEWGGAAEQSGCCLHCSPP